MIKGKTGRKTAKNYCVDVWRSTTLQTQPLSKTEAVQLARKYNAQKGTPYYTAKPRKYK